MRRCWGPTRWECRAGQGRVRGQPAWWGKAGRGVGRLLCPCGSLTAPLLLAPSLGPNQLAHDRADPSLLRWPLLVLEVRRGRSMH